MIRDRDIICIASNWFDHPTSKHHVMRLLARDNRVLWINYHASRRPKLCVSDLRLALRRLAGVGGGSRAVQRSLSVASPLLIPWPESALARRLNLAILRRRIERAFRTPGDRPRQLWLFTPDVPELAERGSFERVVYYCVDDFAAFTGFDARLIERLEARTLAAADSVFATSQVLYERCRAQHPRVLHVSHGVDYEHFARAAEAPPPEPPELARHGRPRLLYMGVLGDYLDSELLAQAAAARPHWSFILLGDVRTPLGPLTQRPNVAVLGGRPYEQLPAYLAYCDVGLIPFRMNRLTRAVNPIKLREYLAAGLPVVSAPLPEVHGFGPAVGVAGDLPTFLHATDQALALRRGRDAAAFQRLVQQESWAERVRALSAFVSASLAEPQLRPSHAAVAS